MPSLPQQLSLACLLAVACSLAQAKQNDPSKLDTTLTPSGAERAANADGSIPAWDGGLKRDAITPDARGGYPDPYATEKPLYVIDKASLARYKALLSPGQLGMFARYPEYRMAVFPTHRSASLPAQYVTQSRANLAQVSLTDGGNGLAGYRYGVAFAEPTEALEVLWNHLTRFRGCSIRRQFASATVQEKGDYTVIETDGLTAFRECISDLADDDQVLFYNRGITTAPSRYAGEVTLVHEPLNQVSGARAAWQYNPGQRRVRRAPTVAYDSSARNSFGQVLADSVDGYNGAPDRYDWTLLGKREMLVPYNAYRMASKQLKYADLLKPGYLNPDYARYEKHRVWVVEATLKPSARHVYAKRRFYLDEDTWQILAAEMYDSRGELWRHYEAHPYVLADIPLSMNALEVTYDLISGRYAATYLSNEVTSRARFGEKMSSSEFTPAQLKRLGN
ncbi:MAG: hypothetical protein GAK45_02113 [Pseudomonas citronellolis]|nr:MAG: hypothetical protein GAK45_02113 [Pseudomonas citronellolis]